MTDLIEEDVFERAVEILSDAGFESSVYSNYSGRGMYGDTCTIGIVTDASGPLVGWAITVAAMENSDYDDLEEVSRKLVPKRTDNMGLQMIYY